MNMRLSFLSPTSYFFPADCPHFKIFTALRLVPEDTRGFQHMAEFFNYNHLIVIADIHRGLRWRAGSWKLEAGDPNTNAFEFSSAQCPASNPLRLTFRHWSGVTPYTSSYEFAGSCVFGKQLPEKLSLRPFDKFRINSELLKGRPYR